MSNQIKVLVMGLPGSGKTTFCGEHLLPMLPTGTHYLNADEVRARANDWDFSREGRLRQAERMNKLAEESNAPIVVIDMVAALERQREIIDPNWIILLDTIEEGRFEDTNREFETPFCVNSHIRSHNFLYGHALDISERIVESYNTLRAEEPHGLMVGRFQPWHSGHYALFLELLKEYGRVVVGIRSMHEDENNPHPPAEVEGMIRESLDKKHKGDYTTIILPNIAGIHWGRGVGYNTGRIHLPADVEAVSATKIRKGHRYVKGFGG